MTGETLQFRIEAPPEEWDRLVGELFELGTLGIEEREGEGLLAWFPVEADAEPAVAALADPARRIFVSGARRVPPTDWERAWREGLGARRVAGLWIRPSWVSSRGSPELQIDPEQAFGSGDHATTRLALELLGASVRAGDRVLDLGAGSGVLALAALRLGAHRALGVDLDRVACACAAGNARRNALAPAWLCGSLDAVTPGARFDGVVANLLWSEVEPWLGRLAAHASRFLVLSGYLRSERSAVATSIREAGLVLQEERNEEQSGDVWCAALAGQGARRLASSSASSVSSKR
jgi:ribosomal protein L11 methyltransferase